MLRRGQKKDHYVNLLSKIPNDIHCVLTNMFVLPVKYWSEKIWFVLQYHNLKPSKLVPLRMGQKEDHNCTFTKVNTEFFNNIFFTEY